MTSGEAKPAIEDETRWQNLLRRLAGPGLGAQLARAASGSLAVKMLAAGVGFAFQLIAARLLGAHSYGAFTYTFSWVLIAAIPARFGLPETVLRFTGSYAAEEGWARLRGLQRRADAWVLVMSLAVALAAAALAFAAGSALDAELRGALLIGLLMLPAIAWLGVKEAAVRGHRRPVLGVVGDAVVRPVVAAVVLMALFASSREALGAAHAMGAVGVGVVCALAFALIALRRVQPPQLRDAGSDTSESGQWWRMGMSLLLIGGINVVRNRTDVLMIGSLLDTTSVGIYAAGARYAELMLFALQSVNLFAAPVIAGLFAQNRHHEIQRMVGLAAIAIVAAAVPIGIVLVAFGPWLLGLFGPGFEAGYGSLLWLTAGQLVNALTGSVGVLMTMTGYHREVGWVAGGAALLNVVLNAVAIPTYGIEGAAMATAATIAIGNSLMCMMVWRKLGIDPTLLGWLHRGRGPGAPS